MSAARMTEPGSRSSPAPGRVARSGVLLLTLLSWVAAASAGHELPFYPGYYPQEIRLDTLPLASAGPRLARSELHAYIGADPFSGGPDPTNIRSTESLGGFVVVTFNPASPAVAGRASRCESAFKIAKSFAPVRSPYIAHPYPVTPYDPDYLEQFDLAQARNNALGAAPSGGPRLRVRAKGRVAEKLIGASGRASETGWDAAVEDVSLDDLLGPHRVNIDGWLGPPWLKQGWFHAYLLQSSAVRDRASQQTIEALYQRLATGSYTDLREAITLERKLVAELIDGCERVVVGYTVRRERFSAEFSQGIENVAYDSAAGLNSAIFVRTAKLKDFPWNGWLRLGMGAKPAAAWNPIAGFSDAAGRLIWAAVGDPAMLADPYGGSWMANRVVPSVTVDAGNRLPVPEDALAPDPDTSALREIGKGVTARAKIVYRVRASAFHDDTRMTVADAIYPYIFASRWGVKRDKSDSEYDPEVALATANLRRSLVGLKVVEVDSEVKKYSDITFTYVVPVIEVYLNSTAADPQWLAAITPPWSPVPWHVAVLMEEAVRRGLGAFSLPEAKRRGVRWLDLARDHRLRDALAPVVDGFAKNAYVPEALRPFVTADEAQGRWAALRQFVRQRGHWLVTNGPYRLQRWTDTSVVLEVFRDFSNPMGVGSFDRFAPPRRAYIARIMPYRDRLEISPEIERVEKFLRDYRIVREPLGKSGSDEAGSELPVCRYIVLDRDGAVVAAGSGGEIQGDRLVVRFKDALRPGQYTALATLALLDNQVNAEITTTQYRVEGVP
jgi:hypothetical protein